VHPLGDKGALSRLPNVPLLLLLTCVLGSQALDLLGDLITWKTDPIKLGN
jgi:hypothetical protein